MAGAAALLAHGRATLVEPWRLALPYMLAKAPGNTGDLTPTGTSTSGGSTGVLANVAADAGIDGFVVGGSCV